MKLRSQKPLLVSQRAVLIQQLDEIDTTSAEYETLLKRVTEIDAILNKKVISRDTLAKGAINVVGLILVLCWEERHVITSKAFNRVQEP
jgi:archaellum biogenesis ATPase FlaH